MTRIAPFLSSVFRSRVHVFGYPLSGLDRLLAMLMVVSLLTSCAVFQRVATDGLNAGSGDSAVVSYSATGVTFDPGPALAREVILDVQADTITDFDEALCVAYQYGVRCDLGDVTVLTTVQVSGTGISVTATYSRADGSRPYHEIGVPSDR